MLYRSRHSAQRPGEVFRSYVKHLIRVTILSLPAFLALTQPVMAQQTPDHFATASEMFEAAQQLEQQGQTDRAFTFHLANVNRFAPSTTTIRSQIEVMRHYVHRRQQQEALDAVNTLLTDFGGVEHFPRYLWQAGELFEKAGWFSLACSTYQTTVENHRPTFHTLRAQCGLIRCHIAQDNPLAAQQDFQDMVQRHRDVKKVSTQILELGRAFSNAGWQDMARIVHQTNVDLHKPSFWALQSQIELIHYYIGQDDPPAAINAYQQLLVDFENNKMLKRLIPRVGRALQKAGWYSLAEGVHADALRGFVADFATLRSRTDLTNRAIIEGDVQAVGNHLQVLMNEHDQNQPLAWHLWQIGRTYVDVHQPDEAIAIFQQAAADFPAAKYGLWSRAETVRCHLVKGDKPSALAEVALIEQSYPQNPHCARMLWKAARYFAAAGHLTDAIDIHELAMEAHFSGPAVPDPEAAVEMVELADSCSLHGRQETAAAIYDSVIATWPTRKAAVMAQIGMAHWSKRGLIANDPNYTLAGIHDLHKNDDKVAQYFTESLEKLYKLSQDTENLKELLVLSDYIIAHLPVENDPFVFDHVYIFRAYCLYGLGRYQEALDLCHYVLGRQPTYQYSSLLELLAGNCCQRLLKDAPADEAAALTRQMESYYLTAYEAYRGPEIYRDMARTRAARNLGMHYSRLKDWSRAETYLNETVRLKAKLRRANDIPLDRVVPALADAQEQRGAFVEAAATRAAFAQFFTGP